MGNWFSWLSSNSTNFEKDFDDIIKGLEINKETLTKENIIDKVFEAIWDDKEYPEKKNKSHISSIIKKLENIIVKLSEKLEKIPENQVEQKEELILYIVESTEKIKKNIAYLKKSMKKFPNAPLTISSSNKTPTPVNNPNNAAARNAAAAKKEGNAPLTNSSSNKTPTPVNNPNNALGNMKNAAPITNLIEIQTDNPPNNKKQKAQDNFSTKSNQNSSEADPKEIFKLIKEFEFKFSTKFFTTKKNGKTTKNIARNTTKPDDVFNFLKVLLLYKKIFPNEENDYIDQLIQKYSTLCPKVDDIKCGLTKENKSFFGKKNTYNSNSQKIKELSENIKNKNSKNFSVMLDEIIPISNANKKIEDENMKK